MNDRTRTLLAVHAHPDDETITMGGTLARYSAEGVRTIVVTCTNGALGEVRGPGLLPGQATRPDSLPPPPTESDAALPTTESVPALPMTESVPALPMTESVPALPMTESVPALSTSASVAALRDRELDAATRRLGVSRTVRLGYSDSGMAGWPENALPGAFFSADLIEAADRLTSIIRHERPQVLVAYDQTGGYGHPDHLKAHQLAVAAFEASGDARPAKLYFVRFPLTWSREFVHALRQAGIDAPGSAPAGADAGPDGHAIGVPDDLVTTAIDVRGYITLKRDALACHASQMPPQHWFMRMPASLRERFWAFEFYSREAGPTSVSPGEQEVDLFAGLD